MGSVRELSGLNSTTQSPSLKDENGNMISDPVITVNLFNTHFCNVHQAVAVDNSITYTQSDSHLLNIDVSYTYGDSRMC